VFGDAIANTEADATTSSLEAPMTLRNRIAVTVLPLALAGPMARGADGSISNEQTTAISKEEAACRWSDALLADSNLPVTKKVGMIVEALRKELASPAPTLRVKGHGDIATQDVNFSNGIQISYLGALANTVNLVDHGDPGALQSALAKEENPDVRDRLMLVMGEITPPKPDPRQAAVYPRIIELVRTNTEASAKFPYEQAVVALGHASRYPSFAGQIVPLLTSLAAKGRAGSDLEAPKIDSLAATAAKDGLHKWGYSLVYDAKGQLQAVRRPQPAAKK
jgi:hypothetical protein